MELGDSEKAPNREYLTVQYNFNIFLGLHVFGAITKWYQKILNLQRGKYQG